MFLAHYGVALAAKRLAPRTSLGTFNLAAQFLDQIWPILLLLGLEHVRIVPGLMAASPLDFVHYPISHSLLTAAAWALLLALGYLALRRYPTGALVIGGAALSHWLLDAPMHRPDLPLWPGSDVMVGGGLWHSVPATLALEFGLFALGLFIYLRTTRARDRIGSWGLWALVTTLAIFFLGSFSGPPPNEDALALGGLVLWLLVPWGYWVDRHRAPNMVSSPAPVAKAHGGSRGL